MKTSHNTTKNKKKLNNYGYSLFRTSGSRLVHWRSIFPFLFLEASGKFKAMGAEFGNKSLNHARKKVDIFIWVHKTCKSSRIILGIKKKSIFKFLLQHKTLCWRHWVQFFYIKLWTAVKHNSMVIMLVRWSQVK